MELNKNRNNVSDSSKSVGIDVPFSGLNRNQIRECIQVEIKSNNYAKLSIEIIERIIDEIDFDADGFSISGCKRVAILVRTYLTKI